MKKTALLLLTVCASSFSFAQNTAKDVFIKDEIVWFGLDFSKARLIGQFDQGAGAAPATGGDIKNKYVSGWNGVVVNETEKYDLKKTFRKTNVFKDLSVVDKSNAKIDPDNIITYNDYKFTNADAVIEEIIKGYEKGEKAEGIGVVFIVEYFSKGEKDASVYVTFFDIASKKVLFREHMIGKAGGFGLRNYWAKCFLEILKQIDSSTYKAWKKNYGM